MNRMYLGSSNLRLSGALMALSVTSLFVPAAVFAAADPSVANVFFSQDAADPRFVEIHYDLTQAQDEPCRVQAWLSTDGGASFPYGLTNATGDVGASVPPGPGNTILWNAFAAYPDQTFDDAVIKIIVDDTELVSAPGGWYEMGARDDEGGEPNEQPRHNVLLDAFEIGRYEVTNGQVAVVLNWALGRGAFGNALGDTYSGGDVYGAGQKLLQLSSAYCQVQFDGTSFSAKERDGHLMEDHPVVMVTWFGAALYCNLLSEMVGLIPCYDTVTWEVDITRNGYRLPTEAEWERAASWDPSRSDVTLPDTTSGGHWIYCFGSDAIDVTRSNYFDGSQFNDPLDLGTSPRTAWVGFFDGANTGRNGATADSPSDVGAYDMSGNVWEWVHDWDGGYISADQTNPTGPAFGFTHVRRGGGWGSFVASCRGAERDGYSPENANIALGFRLCRRDD